MTKKHADAVEAFRATLEMQDMLLADSSSSVSDVMDSLNLAVDKMTPEEMRNVSTAAQRLAEHLQWLTFVRAGLATQ
jgi:hypothetical protein